MLLLLLPTIPTEDEEEDDAADLDRFVATVWWGELISWLMGEVGEGEPLLFPLLLFKLPLDESMWCVKLA